MCYQDFRIRFAKIMLILVEYLTNQIIAITNKLI